MKAPLTDGAATDLRLDILLDDLQPDVGENQVPDIASELAALKNFYRGYAQRLLPDFTCLGVVATGHGAADIGLVTLAGGPGDQRLAIEDRLEDGDIVILVATAEHIVVQDDVAGVDVVTEKAHHVFAGRLQREGQHRYVLGLFQHPAFGIVQTGDKIARLIENRRARRAQQRQAHLLGDRLQTPLQHRDLDRIALHGCALFTPGRRLSTQLPSASICAAQPGGTRMLVLALSISAGPLNWWPCSKRSPS